MNLQKTSLEDKAISEAKKFAVIVGYPWALFQVKFDSREDVHQKAKKRFEQFFISLQQDVKDWISLATTKTGMVYHLKGNAPQSHE